MKKRMTPGPEPSELAAVARIASRAAQADGHPPFSDQSLVDLRLGRRELLLDGDRAAASVGAAVVAAAIVGATEAEFVVDPDARGAGHGTAMLESLLARSPAGLRVWAHGGHPAARALAASHGMSAVRELLHLTAEVPRASALAAPPQDEAPAASGSPGGIRPFVPDQDEDEWVALNALTFRAHPEQGAVDLDDLRQLQTEAWFRAEDFLVLRDAGGPMIGYCWLKATDDRVEFYAVGVHPDWQGRKLGARLIDAGFARIAAQGITRAHLYVEGDNAAALALYRGRGFAQDSIDIQYAR